MWQRLRDTLRINHPQVRGPQVRIETVGRGIDFAYVFASNSILPDLSKLARPNLQYLEALPLAKVAYVPSSPQRLVNPDFLEKDVALAIQGLQEILRKPLAFAVIGSRPKRLRLMQP